MFFLLFCFPHHHTHPPPHSPHTVQNHILFFHYWYSLMRYCLLIFTSDVVVVVLCWCFTALWHFFNSFRCGQSTYPHCSWASLLGSLPVLSAHSFASNWQLPFLNQRKGENCCRNYFMTNLYERMLLDMRIEHATIRTQGERTSDWATMPTTVNFQQLLHIINTSPTWGIQRQDRDGFCERNVWTVVGSGTCHQGLHHSAYVGTPVL